MMGAYFPLSKKLTQSQQAAATAASVANGSNLIRIQRNVFNMFLPVQFVTHSHINGGITVFNQLQQLQQQQPSLDYQKALLDSYAPFATFFDWICRNMFSRRLIATSSTPATAASSSTDSAAALQATKQLIDLVLVISQQTLLMNVSFVAHLNEYLQEQSINNVSLFHSLHSGLNLSHLNPAGLEFYNLILESNYFHSFIQTVLTDYRYLLNKKEIYEFMQIFLSYFIANPNKSVLSTAKGTTTNKSTSSMLLNLKGSQIFYFL